MNNVELAPFSIISVFTLQAKEENNTKNCLMNECYVFISVLGNIVCVFLGIWFGMKGLRASVEYSICRANVYQQYL